jgi:hypothetical protein
MVFDISAIALDFEDNFSHSQPNSFESGFESCLRFKSASLAFGINSLCGLFIFKEESTSLIFVLIPRHKRVDHPGGVS